MSETPPSVLQWLRLSNRDVSDIWIGCLVTISASTFLALHLSVEPYTPPATPRSLLKKWWLSRFNHEFRRQVLWTIVMVIAPELMVGFSFGDWRAASIGSHMFKSLGKGRVNEWSKTHASFANMGGLKFKMKTDSPNGAQFRLIDEKVLLETFKNADVYNTTFRILGCLIENYTMPLILFLENIFKRFSDCLKSLWASIKIFGRAKASTAPPHDRSPAICSPTQNIELTNLNTQPGTLRNSVRNRRETDEPIRNEASSAQAENSGSHVPGEAISSMAASATGDNNASQHSRTDRDRGAMDLVHGEVILYLNAAQIVVGQYLGILDEGPLLNEEAIEDKSKTNPLAKGIAVISLFWFILGIFIQLFQNEELTQLELSTFTYAICAAIAYCLYWTKPQAVEVPIEHSVMNSDAVRSITHNDMDILKDSSGSPFLRRNCTPRFYKDNRIVEPSEPVPTDVSLTVFAIVGSKEKAVLLYDADLGSIAMGVVFGAIYCLGWNNAFPSRWEQLAWRISSLTITASLIPYSIANAICTIAFGRLTGSRARMTHPVHILALVFLGSVYVACRFFMLYEMIRALIT
ncbi:hypothetical protein F5Y00DRAFT_101408 [Daldinia vernicosa]|uniref:uncharacterized protein n=1 Tax=Daldinia vernicosa TaxID=114800 RepID=UPI002008017D|nr:uncharacterized protein F5Y00DRAFT_101408 [Daldinia vernicosa]KAI0853446.1 hypothetical protein F5Y00DRAFT_101408 [Daldinia vernicosa]